MSAPEVPWWAGNGDELELVASARDDGPWHLVDTVAPEGADPSEAYAHLVTFERLTSAAVPVQYEGRVLDACAFYFRARGSRAQLGLGLDSDAAVEATFGRGGGLGYAWEHLDPDQLDALEDDRAAYEELFVRLLRRIIATVPR